MAGAESRYGILIEAKYQAATAFSQATQDVRRLNAELKTLAPTLNGNTAANLKYADTFVKLDQAKSTLRGVQQELLATAKATNTAQAAVEGLAQGVAAKAGPFGALANSLIGVNAGAALAVAGVGAVGTALLFSAKSTASYALELRNMSETGGIAENTLAALRLGASETGRDFAQLQTGLFKFSHSIGEAVATPTGEAAKMFKGLGIAVTDAAGNVRSGEDVFRDVADKIEHAGTASERSRIAFDAFGRGGVSFALILQKGMADLEAQTKKMGLALSPGAEQSALRFHAAEVKVEESTRGLNLALGGTAAGPMTDFNEGLAVGIQRMTTLVNIAKLVKFNPMVPGMVEWNTDRLLELTSKRSAPMSMAGTSGDRDLFPALDPEAAAARAKVTEDQEKQLSQLDALIAGKDRLRAANRLTLEDEISELQKLADQAIAMDDQVVGAKELERIRRELNRLATTGPLSQQDRDLIEWLKTSKLGGNGLTVGPTSKSELLTPQFMQGGGIDPWTNMPKLPAGTSAPDTISAVEMKNGLPDLEQFLRNGKQANKNLEDQGKRAKKNFDFDKFAQDQLGAASKEFFFSAITDFKNLGQNVERILTNLIASIAAQAASSFVMKLFFPVGKQDGGMFVGAQGGLAIAGTRGLDSIPVMMGKGEGIFDHSIMDRMRSFLSAPWEYIRGRDAGALSGIRGQSATPSRESVQSAAASSAPAVDAAPRVLELHYHGSGGGPLPRERSEIMDWLKNDIMPLWEDAQSHGGYRRGR